MDVLATFIAQYLYLFSIAAAATYFLLRARPVQKSMIRCGIIVVLCAYVISRIVAYLYYDPRPFVVGHFVPLIAHAADNGFPSDHVLLTGTIAAALWFYNKKLSGIVWAIAFLIGWARVYAGVHHAADIVGSIVIVLMSMAIYHVAVQKRKIAM